VDAQRLPIRAPWPPARIGHFGPLATVRAAGSIAPPRARVSGVSPIPFAGAGHGVTPTHPFARQYATPRLVATCGVRGGGSVDLRPLAGKARISLQGYVAYLLNIRILSPVAPLDWSVFMWRIELTCGPQFGRLLTSCISVLSFHRLYFGGYSIFRIARSIDPAPLPSDNKSTMGPGFAVVGTPGSPSDVARTKVLLPRL